MAHIINCSVCGESTALPHPECRVIELEDLIFRLQERIKTGKGLDQDLSLITEIVFAHAQSKKVALATTVAEKAAELSQKQYEGALGRFLQEKAEEFRRENPPPSDAEYA